jgi:hypothetical protein
MQRQIGAFFVAWGTLESEMDIAFPVLFRLDPNLAANDKSRGRGGKVIASPNATNSRSS